MSHPKLILSHPESVYLSDIIINIFISIYMFIRHHHHYLHIYRTSSSSSQSIYLSDIIIIIIITIYISIIHHHCQYLKLLCIYQTLSSLSSSSIYLSDIIIIIIIEYKCMQQNNFFVITIFIFYQTSSSSSSSLDIIIIIMYHHSCHHLFIYSIIIIFVFIKHHHHHHQTSSPKYLSIGHIWNFLIPDGRTDRGTHELTQASSIWVFAPKNYEHLKILEIRVYPQIHKSAWWNSWLSNFGNS